MQECTLRKCPKGETQRIARHVVGSDYQTSNMGFQVPKLIGSY